jgi:putative CocE/NonD family hydrolase
VLSSVYYERIKGLQAGPMAEQGFNVLVVSSRGSFGSTGDYSPFLSERADAQWIIAWLKKQEWFNGEICAGGFSYNGYSGWAIGEQAGQMLKVISTKCAGSRFRDMLYSGDALFLEVFLFWMDSTHAQQKSTIDRLKVLAGNKRRRKLALHLPVAELDKQLLGYENTFWRDWLAHVPGDDWWAQGDNSSAVLKITAPNHMVSGWHDFFLPLVIRDYNTLKELGRSPYLTIGPWNHEKAAIPAIKEELIWFKAHVLNDRKELREAPVHIFVMGVNEWRDYPVWPPQNMEQQRWYLQAERGFTASLPAVSGTDHYTFDPSDPTPSVGGASVGRPVEDNRKLESRDDVLTFTSGVLNEDLEIIGPVAAELFVKSSLDYTDFFVKLCDVQPSGKSLNVCDGLQRLFPGKPAPDADEIMKVKMSLWPIAYRFKRGHRIRVQISSGAFPRWNRNLGTDEPLGTGTTMIKARQSIYHGPDHPSGLLLPRIISFERRCFTTNS